MTAKAAVKKTGILSRQQRRVTQTREKLLNAARLVFTEKGLGASVDEISERADVARGSFYYHFKNKERLIRYIVDDILSQLTDRMVSECSGCKGLEAVLDGMIEAHLGFFSSRWEDFVLYYLGRADLTLTDSYDGLEKPFLEYARSIERLIDASINEPISETRLRRVSNAIAGFVSGYYSFASIATPTINIEKEFTALRQAFVSSLARFAREALPDRQVRW